MTVAQIKPKREETPEREEFAGLYEALRAAQATLPEVGKNRTAKVKGKSKSGNEFEYSYKYADITDVLSAIRPHFARFGLTILQPTRIDGSALQVATRIVHDKTGQCEESLYPVAAIGADHQALGSALTYARRYALCSMIGLAPDEDVDGQHAAASGAAGGERHPPRDPQPRQQQAAPQVRPQARKFVDKACADIEEVKGDVDAVWAKFDEIKARPGWEQLTASEKQVVILAKGKALPDDLS